MAIEAVKNYSVRFQQTQKASLKSQQSFTSNSEVDEEKSNAAKYMIGATALAAVIGLGVAGYNGKLGKSVQKFLGGAENAVKDGAQNVGEAATETLTGTSSKVAKKKFVDGKEYTGFLGTKKAKLTYENGYIVKSELADGTVKVYGRDANGFVDHVSITKPNDYTLNIYKEKDGSISMSKHILNGSPSFKLASGRQVESGSIWYDTKITPDGKSHKIKIEQYNLSSKNYKNGEEIALRREIDLETNETKTFRRTKDSIWYPSAKGHKVINGKKFSIIYDKEGKIECAHHTLYNPKTNTITRESYKMQDGKLVPWRTDQIDKKTGNMLSRFEDGHIILDLNNNIPKKGRFYNGDLVERDIEKIKQIIAEKGFNFNV